MWPWKNKTEKEADQIVDTEVRCSPAVQAIVDSLKANPDAWRSSSHALHIGGEVSLLAPIRIWIANGEDSVRLETGPFVCFTEVDRKAIWGAFQDWQKRETQTEQFIAVLRAAEQTSRRIQPSESGDSARKNIRRDRRKSTAKRSKSGLRSR